MALNLEGADVIRQRRECPPSQEQLLGLNLTNSGLYCRKGGFWRDRSDLRHMPHLAARPRRTLAVEVDGGARNHQPLLEAVDIVRDQIWSW